MDGLVGNTFELHCKRDQFPLTFFLLLDCRDGRAGATEVRSIVSNTSRKPAQHVVHGRCPFILAVNGALEFHHVPEIVVVFLDYEGSEEPRVAGEHLNTCQNRSIRLMGFLLHHGYSLTAV